jgi:hypothetical protein
MSAATDRALDAAAKALAAAMNDDMGVSAEYLRPAAKATVAAYWRALLLEALIPGVEE